MIVDIEHDARRGLEVKRFHTWPTIRGQSTGEHSAQVMRILLAVWPDAPRRMLVHCLTHDIGEMAGDLPWPAKKDDPILKDRMEMAETKVHAFMTARWQVPNRNPLDHYQQRVFKLCESIEMWEFALTEQNMGNRYAAVVAVRMLLQASALLGELEPSTTDYPDIRPAIKKYVEKRKEQEIGNGD